MITTKRNETLARGVALVAVTLLSGCSWLPLDWMGGDQPQRLDERAARALLTDKTVTARNLNNGKVSVSHYAADGTVRQVRDGRDRRGTWRVTKGGRVCLTMQSRAEQCRVVKRGGDGVYRKYRVESGVERPVIAYESFLAGDQRARVAAGLRPGRSDAVRSARQRNMELQRLLAQAGYAPGPIDGIWGARSRGALMRLQADRGLPSSGEPSEALLVELSRPTRSESRRGASH